MSASLDILQEVSELHIGISQRDNAKMFHLLSAIHPLRVLEYPSDAEHNGWIVPKEYRVEKATIKKDGVELFDGTCHPLAVVGSSGNFSGTISKAELDKHVYYSKPFPEAFLYHPMNNLRPWQNHWGFCIPYSTYCEWPTGEYQVDLQVSFHASEMLVGDCHHRGSSSETIVFNAHTCHPCQINDGLSGAAVILELFRWLSTERTDTHFNYIGVLGPEHLGTVFYIANMSEEERRNLKLGVFLESVGTDSPLALQQTFTGKSPIDEIAEYSLRSIDKNLHVGPFRTVVGNDETVWEAPGVEVPMVSMTRHPFDEYHTSEDNVDKQSRSRLDEMLGVCKRIVSILEDDRTIERKFDGLIALSNPRYNLYRQRGNTTLDYGLSDQDRRWGLLQDYIPRYFNGRHSVFQIARAAKLPFEDVLSYVKNFEAHDLVSLKRLSSTDDYENLAPLPDLPEPTI